MWKKVLKAAAVGLTVMCLMNSAGTAGMIPETSLTVCAVQTQGDFSYELSEDGNTAVITAYHGKGGKVAVPDTAGGKPVSAIGSDAFDNNESVTEVTVPEGVVKIGKNAFKGCNGMTKITLPEGLEEIGEYAFWYCTKLTEAVLPESMKHIGSYAFFNCTSLKSAVIPEGMETIGGWAFSGCGGLANVNVPASVKIVGSCAFDNTGWYASQNSGDVMIGSCYYKYKGEMPDNYVVSMPEETTVIADGAFSECSHLTGIFLPSGITRIGSSLFYHCRHLAEITLPQSVTTVEANAFFGCENLKSITLPDSVEELGENAFSECLTLTRVVLPQNLRHIGESAFVGCYQLSDVIYVGTRESFDRIMMDDRTRELLLSKITFVSSSQDVPKADVSSTGRQNGSRGGEGAGEGAGNASARRAAASAAIESENKVWRIVIMIGIGFIVLMLLLFIIRAVVGMFKRRTQSAAPQTPEQPRMPKWRNLPSEQKKEETVGDDTGESGSQ